MRDAFSPAFFLSLFLLFLGHQHNVLTALLFPVSGLVFLCALIFFILRRYFASYLLCLLSIALVLTMGFCKEKEKYIELRQLAFPTDLYLTIEGSLIDYPEIREDRVVLMVRSSRISWRNEVRSVSMNIRITVQGRSSKLHRGDKIVIDALLFSSDLNRNFFKNPYEDYLLARSIHAQGFCKSLELIQVVKRAPLAWQLIGKWRQAIRKLIEDKYKKMGILAQEGVFLEAILLGDRGKLDERIEENLIRSGVLHLIAISGANIAIMAIFCLFIFRWMGMRIKWRYGLTGFVLLLFLVISGFDISAQRAVMMALLLFASRIFFQQTPLTKAIALSGLAILAIHTENFLDPGFMLTFALTYSLVVGREVFAPLIEGKGKLIREFLVLNLSAGLFSFPLSLKYFQRYSFAGVVAGLALIPLSMVITAGGSLLIPLSLLSQPSGRVVLWLLHPFLKIFFWITSFFASLNWEVFRPSPSWFLLIALFLLFVLLAMKGIPKWVRLFFAGGFFILLLVPLVIYKTYTPKNLELYFLDVGQGDAQVVVFPGGDALLVDGGGSIRSNFPVGKRLVLPFILQKGIRVKWVAITHFHPDHVAGVLEMLPALKPEEIWISAAPENSPFFHQLLDLAKGRCRVMNAQQGFYRQISGCTVSVIYPQSFIHDIDAKNDHSMVIRIADGRHSFLLTGDITSKVEKRLVDEMAASLSSTVLKISHHGSPSSSSSDFLDAVHPQWAVISCGSANAFGFPHMDVIVRLKRANISWFSTARCGGIEFISEPRALRIIVSK